MWNSWKGVGRSFQRVAERLSQKEPAQSGVHMRELPQMCIGGALVCCVGYVVQGE